MLGRIRLPGRPNFPPRSAHAMFLHQCQAGPIAQSLTFTHCRCHMGPPCKNHHPPPFLAWFPAGCWREIRAGFIRTLPSLSGLVRIKRLASTPHPSRQEQRILAPTVSSRLAERGRGSRGPPRGKTSVRSRWHLGWRLGVFSRSQGVWLGSHLGKCRRARNGIGGGRIFTGPESRR
jgi:hypothetical protein